jgi:CubicO group peptidase (beta-lactamase class C family)
MALIAIELRTPEVAYRIIVASLLAALYPGSALAQTPSTMQLYFPTSGSWEVVRGKDAGVDSQELERALEFAGSKRSKGVVVLWRGRILAERYWDGWTQDTTHPAYSATKSLVSTLVAMAIEDGKITSTDQSAAEFLAEWRGKEKYEAITIGHLLSMTSGLEGGKRNFLRGVMSRDERGFATSLPVEFPPGTHWDYHNSAYRLCFPLLQEATGDSLPRYTHRKLLDPLGMKHTKWASKRFATDQYTFLTTSARDAARYGLLILAKGNWNGKQLISREWVERATTPVNPRVNPSYGYLWWLNGGEHHYRPLVPRKQRRPIFPGCPDDAFAALGKDDQKIYIVPSLDVVVTRLGDAADSTTPAISSFDVEFLGQICRSFAE